MGNLLVMLLNGGRFKGRQVLSEESVRAMLTRQFANDPELPGFGYTFWEDRSFAVPGWSHGGSMEGFGAFIYVIPQHRIGVFIAFNQESSTLSTAALSTLITALYPAARSPLRPRYTGADDAARFAGKYASSIHNHREPTRGWQRVPIDVTVNDSGQLVFQRQRANRVGPAMFQMPDGVLVKFRQDERGRITHMFVNQMVFERIRNP
jgi:CubicO group peptidase (beta-lactamase class C family)